MNNTPQCLWPFGSLLSLIDPLLFLNTFPRQKQYITCCCLPYLQHPSEPLGEPPRRRPSRAASQLHQLEGSWALHCRLSETSPSGRGTPAALRPTAVNTRTHSKMDFSCRAWCSSSSTETLLFTCLISHPWTWWACGGRWNTS